MRSTRGWVVLGLVVPVTLATWLGPDALVDPAAAAKAAPRQKAAAAPRPAAVAPVDVGSCFGCHPEIQEFHARGKHAKVNCAHCHAQTAKHAEDPEQKPVTRMEHAVCGGCHQAQYESLVSVNLQSKAKVEKATFKSRSPLFDKLIAPHGFSKEHGEPRSHVFMVVDQFVVDRAFGGRFQWKDWTRVQDARGAERDTWELLIDKEPGSSDQKIFLPQTATAANPVCYSCKSQDHILTWKYLGDPDPNAQWSRTSKPVEMARSVKHPMNCFICHDPHSTEPRVVRDALIDAVVDRGAGAYPYDAAKSRQTTLTKVTFRDFRAIGILNRPDSNLLCAQCHVEYNCNPGFDPRTGAPIGMADRRTNFFPWVSVLDLQQKYEAVGFKDFRHAVTGAGLTKIQHPETETYWGSTHERKGVECKDCHMPKLKTKAGKSYTFHGQRSSRYMKKDTCTRCHSGWTEEQAEYQIEAVQNYIRGKMTKAEFWLGQLIDKYEEARVAGVPEAALAQARARHDTAHILWEWWTAENSDGFHNPTLARESLARSLDASQAGIALLEKALAEVRSRK
ncbi:MAG: ammonia-forming cytochrome c nitrite reductase subunit c552 [Candidatus Methylomirabilota bacterium]